MRLLKLIFQGFEVNKRDLLRKGKVKEGTGDGVAKHYSPFVVLFTSSPNTVHLVRHKVEKNVFISIYFDPQYLLIQYL